MNYAQIAPTNYTDTQIVNTNLKMEIAQNVVGMDKHLNF